MMFQDTRNKKIKKKAGTTNNLSQSTKSAPSIFSKDKRNIDERMQEHGHHKSWKKKDDTSTKMLKKNKALEIDLPVTGNIKIGKSSYASLKYFSASLTSTYDFDTFENFSSSGDEAEKEDIEIVEKEMESKKTNKKSSSVGMTLISSTSESENVPDDWMERFNDDDDVNVDAENNNFEGLIDLKMLKLESK